MDRIGTAVHRGQLSFNFLDLSHFDRFSARSGKTFQSVSEESRIPVELLMVIREAIGFAQPRPEDHIREDERRILPAIQSQLAKGFRTEVIERWLRVYGESLRRIAETEADWWHAEFETPMLESGVSEGEMLEITNQWEISVLLDDAVMAVYHGQQEHAWMQNIITGVEGALERAGLRTKLLRPPAMCFLDITGYTQLTEKRGDEAAAQLVGELARLVQRTSQQHGGKPVKWLGDGVMFHFREPPAAVLASLEMVEGIAAAGLPPAHVGLHAGPIVFQDGDYYGMTVNAAARIADYARPGEVLVSQEVVDSAPLDGVAFMEIGPIQLKGLSNPLHLHVARRAV
jgi:class 3 adenylate cyclase